MPRQIPLRAEPDEFPTRTISPLLELGAYEALWARDKMSFKQMADLFEEAPDALPSEIAGPKPSREKADWVLDHFRKSGVERFGIRVHRAGEYPPMLRDARHPVEVLTYQGLWNWVETTGVAVVGSREPSDEGIRRARKLVKMLVADNFTVVSGLARGIDEVAHSVALEMGAPTIAVIGTPLNAVYPPEHEDLQKTIADQWCVISQIPAYRYSRQNPRSNRFFFPERNATMSALSVATVIVEAGETSGTLSQARAALHQGRQLFILDSNFRNPDLTWPQRYAEKGAIRIADYDELLDRLQSAPRPATSNVPE